MKGEQQVCVHCGYPKHTSEHAPNCPAKGGTVESTKPKESDLKFEDDVHDFFDPRINLAKQGGKDGEATANRYRRLRNELKLLADLEKTGSLSLARVSEAMTETLGVMATLGSEYRDGFETETQEEQKEREDIAKKAETVFRQSCEKIYDNVRVSLDRISSELQIIANKLKRTESPILGGMRETVGSHLELIQEQGGAASLRDQDPYKLIGMLNQMFSGYGEELQNDGWTVEETRLKGQVEPQALETFKKDLVFANEAMYRIMLLTDQLKLRVGDVLKTPRVDKQPAPRSETQQNKEEKERKQKFAQALDRLLKEENTSVELATRNKVNQAKEFGVYVDAFALYDPTKSKAEAIYEIMKELQDHISQNTSEDSSFIKLLKAQKEFMKKISEKHPKIVDAFKKAKKDERERQLLTTQDFADPDLKLFFLAHPEGMLGHLFEYMRKNGVV